MDSWDCLAHYRSWSSESPAESARGEGPTASLDWQRNSVRKLPSTTSTDRFSYDCMWRAKAHGKKGKSGCGVYLPDLEHPRPPDVPPGMVKLRLVKNE